MIMAVLIQPFGAGHHERGPAETAEAAYVGAVPDTSSNKLDDSSQSRGRIDDRDGSAQAAENAIINPDSEELESEEGNDSVDYIPDSTWNKVHYTPRDEPFTRQMGVTENLDSISEAVGLYICAELIVNMTKDLNLYHR
jgi:hypothetical protein